MKKIYRFLVIFISFILFPSVAHAYIVKDFGGSNSDSLQQILPLKSGGYVAVGYSASSDGDIPGNHGNNGNYDAIIVKFDQNNNKVWVKNFGGSNDDIFYSVLPTNDGGFIASGESYSTDGDISSNKGGDDAILVRYDSNGNVLWKKNYGGTRNDYFSGSTLTNDGNFAFIGNICSLDGDFPAVKGPCDGIVTKIDGNGAILWTKHYGGSNGIIISNIHQTNDGGFIVSGGSQSSNGDFISNKGDYDAFILKLDSNGNKVWLTSIGGSANDYFNDVIQAADGTIYAVGYSYSSNGDIPSNKGAWDAIIAKFDQNGNKLWVKDYGGTNGEQLSSIIQSANGNFLAVGYGQSLNGDVPSTKGGADGLLIQFDQNGNILSHTNYGGSSFDELSYITKNADGNPLILEWSSSNNGDNPKNQGSEDAYIFFSPLMSFYTTANIGIQSGGFSLSNVLSSADFGNITIDGTVKMLPIHLGNIQITDNRGTLDGWNVTVSATPFTATSNSSKILGANSLVLNGISSINRLSGTSNMSFWISGSASIDSGAVKILSAAANTGAGTFDVVFPANSLIAYIDTSNAIIDTASTVYQSTITWTLNVGP